MSTKRVKQDQPATTGPSRIDKATAAKGRPAAKARVVAANPAKAAGAGPRTPARHDTARGALAKGRGGLPAQQPGISPSAILSRILALRPSLGPAVQRIADFVVEHPAEVVHMSVSEVAERTGASEGSVVGLCKSLGATGFQQLKIVLAQETVRPVQMIHEDLEATDDASIVMGKIFRSNAQTLHDTHATLSAAAIEQAVRLLRSAKRIEIYGIGSAATIAEDAHYRMLRIGLNAKAVVDSHVQAISASLAGPDVAVLTISHSGSTHETVMATRLAKEAGAKTICITNFGKSPIQAYADVLLFTMARETQFRTEAMTSRLAQLAIIDVLIACLALRDYDRAVQTIRQTFEVLSLKRY